MAFRTRAPVLADAESLARLHVAAWQSGYAELLPADQLAAMSDSIDRRIERWRSAIEHAGSGPTVLVADDENAAHGEVYGFVMAGDPRDAPDAGEDAGDAEAGLDRAGELWAINVDPAAWGRGVGSALLMAGTAWLAERYPSAYLWVLDGNTRACRLYERHGWRADGGVKTDQLHGFTVRELRYRCEFGTGTGAGTGTGVVSEGA